MYHLVFLLRTRVKTQAMSRLWHSDSRMLKSTSIGGMIGDSTSNARRYDNLSRALVCRR